MRSIERARVAKGRERRVRLGTKRTDHAHHGVPPEDSRIPPRGAIETSGCRLDVLHTARERQPLPPRSAGSMEPADPFLDSLRRRIAMSHRDRRSVRSRARIVATRKQSYPQLEKKNPSNT